MAITEIRQRFHSTSKEAFLNIPIESKWQNLKISVPKIGDKYKLVNLCFKNAKNIQKDRIRKNEELRHRLDNKRVLEQLQHDLRLSSKPVISNVLTTPIYKALIQWQLVWFSKTLNPARRITVCLILKPYQALMILHLWKRWYIDAINA